MRELVKIFIFWSLVIVLFFSCKKEVSEPSFEDEFIYIHFPNFQKAHFRSVENFNDKGTGKQYSKYLSKGEQPHIVIAKVSNHTTYEQLQKGIREVYPFDFVPGFTEDIMTLPTHTEVINDTTFLLGHMWYGSENMHDLKEDLHGSSGWKVSIIRPASVVYVNIWYENKTIPIDSLLFWSIKIREEMIINFKDLYKE